MKAILMLEDGESFNAEVLGNQEADIIGKVVLNTAVVGYQEMMTDPANAGKILVLTYPLIGNYGINPKFNQSAKCWLNGLVIKEKSRIYSNWQAKSSLDDFIKQQSLLTITGVDTRTLTVHLREKGEQWGIISTSNENPQQLLAKIKKSKNNQNFLDEISGVKYAAQPIKKYKYRLAILNLGIANDILKQLEILGIGYRLFAYNTKPEEILKSGLRGLIISDGPEEDAGLAGIISNIKLLVGKIPILGISTGCRVLALALGARINKMKLGHRGLNYPMYRPGFPKAEITAQNHSYIIEPGSLKKIKAIKIIGYNLNDNTIEEFESKKLKLMGVQYYPASYGFDEPNIVFKNFLKMLKGV